jgi:ADP-ribose pyrophosphatase
MHSDESPPPVWERESSEPLHEYDLFRTRRDRSRSPQDGSLHEFDIVESQDGVTVIALTPEGEVVLVEQFRHALRQLSLETPSGILEEGESPTIAGLRELKEETGYSAPSAEEIGTVVLNPSWLTTRVHVLLARNATRNGDKDLDESEDTSVRLASEEEVLRMVGEGKISSAAVVSALAFWQWSKNGVGRG